MFYPKIPPLRRLIAAALRLPRFVLGAVVLCGLWGCAGQTYNTTRFTTVVIDAGHGGHDSGTVSKGGLSRKSPRVLEKDCALDVARRVKTRLEGEGLRLVMTRSSDVFIPLDTRVAISNRYHDSIFVSIHFNDCRKRQIHGAEVYHNGRGTDAMARRIVRSLAAVPGEVNRGTKRADYRVLRKSLGPAVLIECGYLSHPGEAERCATAAYRQKLAEAIARAIMEQRRQGN